MWKILERVVHIIIMVLLIIMLAVIFQNSRNNLDDRTFALQLENYKTENSDARTRNLALIEKRHATLQEQQDAYQVMMDKRMTALENLVKANYYKNMYYNKKLESGMKTTSITLITGNNKN